MVSGLSVPSAPERLDLERRAFLDLLCMANTMAAPEDLARQLVLLAQHLSGCEAVGIRLKTGPGFPYAASLGFSKRFVSQETDLCVTDEDGHLLRNAQRQPILACLCGRVLAGQVDDGLPCFTARGSFITPSTSELLQATAETRSLGQTRNRCHLEGYETVGLFPIRLDGVTYGLIQCNDPRPGCLGPDTIDLMEAFAEASAHLFQLAMA
jgi:hypothetical protein